MFFFLIENMKPVQSCLVRLSTNELIEKCYRFRQPQVQLVGKKCQVKKAVNDSSKKCKVRLATNELTRTYWVNLQMNQVQMVGQVSWK